MNDKGMTTAWFTLGLGMAYLALNLVAATQQWPLGFALPSLVSFNEGAKNAQEVTATKAFYGFALLTPALLVQLALTIVHARRKAAYSRAERIPISSGLAFFPRRTLEILCRRACSGVRRLAHLRDQPLPAEAVLRACHL